MSINKENVKDIKLIDKIIDGIQDIVYDITTSDLSTSTLKDVIDEVKALIDTRVKNDPDALELYRQKCLDIKSKYPKPE